MLRFDRTGLTAKLIKISPSHQFAFLLLLCQRMMPAFDRFANETGFDHAESRKFIRDAWKFLAGDLSVSETYSDSDPNRIGAPDHEHYNHPLTYAALNAAVSASCLASFMSSPSVDSVAEGAQLGFDTAFQYVQSVVVGQARLVLSGRELRQKAQEWTDHVVAQSELRRQASDLDFVSILPTQGIRLALDLVKERAHQQEPTIPL